MPSSGFGRIRALGTVVAAGVKWLSPDGDYAVMELLCRATDEAEYLRRALSLGEVPRHYVLPNGSFVSHTLRHATERIAIAK